MLTAGSEVLDYHLTHPGRVRINLSGRILARGLSLHHIFRYLVLPQLYQGRGSGALALRHAGLRGFAGKRFFAGFG